MRPERLSRLPQPWKRGFGLAARGIAREDLFVTTKLWNTNHRADRVEGAFKVSLERLRIDYLDLYLSHTPFAFQPGDEHDPRDQDGNITYDRGVTFVRDLASDGEP